jgi:uncharacterized membrane protein YjjP (DUF1212 family)
LKSQHPCSSDFSAVCQVVVSAGTLMAAAGTGAYRVKEEMNRVGLALGLDAVHAEVTLNTVIATCLRQGQSYTLVGTIPAVSVNAGRIVEMEALALSTPPGTSVADFARRLEIIARQPARYGPFMTALAALVACAAFCFLNHGGWVECLGVAVGAGAGQFLRATLARYRLNQLGVTLMAGATACLLYLGVTGLLMSLGVPSARQAAGYTSAVLFLIPGFPLITAALDLARLDFTAGISRLTYAILVVTVAAISAWLVAELVHLVPLRAPELNLPRSTLLLLQLLASFCGVFGFAIMFNTPPRIALAAACIGMLANTLRIYLVDVQWSLQVAAPIATLLVGLLAAGVSRWMRCPRIVLSVPPVLIMIPGTTAYQALVYANQNLPMEAMANAYEAMFIVAGIAIGLSIARMLTDRAWAFEGRLPGASSG